MHDEGMRKAYRDSDRFEKLGYEEAFLSFIRKLHNDMQKKIKRNMDRLAVTQPTAGVSFTFMQISSNLFTSSRIICCVLLFFETKFLYQFAAVILVLFRG